MAEFEKMELTSADLVEERIEQINMVAVDSRTGAVVADNTSRPPLRASRSATGFNDAERMAVKSCANGVITIFV